MNELTILGKDSNLKDTEKVYSCQFINSRKVSVPVFEYCKLLFELEPGGEFLVEMWDPSVTYAPFSKVVFEEGDKVVVKRNSLWSLPQRPGQYELECLNEAGSTIEALYLTNANETPVHCYRGIPRFVAIPLESKYIKFRRVIWRLIKKKVQDPNNHDFLIWSSRVEQVMEPRSKSELDEIEAELKARAKEQLEKTMNSLKQAA